MRNSVVEVAEIRGLRIRAVVDKVVGVAWQAHPDTRH